VLRFCSYDISKSHPHHTYLAHLLPHRCRGSSSWHFLLHLLLGSGWIPVEAEGVNVTLMNPYIYGVVDEPGKNAVYVITDSAKCDQNFLTSWSNKQKQSLPLPEGWKILIKCFQSYKSWQLSTLKRHLQKNPHLDCWTHRSLFLISFRCRKFRCRRK